MKDNLAKINKGEKRREREEKRRSTEAKEDREKKDDDRIQTGYGKKEDRG